MEDKVDQIGNKPGFPMSTTLDRTSEFPEGLGCLVQAARRLSFRSFHFWPILLLVSVGLFSIGWHAWEYYSEEEGVKNSFSERGLFGYSNTEYVKNLKKYIKLEVNRRLAFHGGGMAVGVICLILAFFVPRAPIACATMGLALYVADWLMDWVRHFTQGDWQGQLKYDFASFFSLNNEVFIRLITLCVANGAVVVLFVLCIRKDVGYLRMLRKLEEDQSPDDESENEDTKTEVLEVKSKTKALEMKSPKAQP